MNTAVQGNLYKDTTMAPIPVANKDMTSMKNLRIKMCIYRAPERDKDPQPESVCLRIQELGLPVKIRYPQNSYKLSECSVWPNDVWQISDGNGGRCRISPLVRQRCRACRGLIILRGPRHTRTTREENKTMVFSKSNLATNGPLDWSPGEFGTAK